MLPRRLKLGIALFATLSVALVGNLLFMQPGSGRSGGERVAGSGQRTAQMLSVAVGEPVAATEPKGQRTALGKTPEPQAGPPVEGAEAIRSVQRELQARGYEAGTPDGVPGLITRAAVLAWEHDHGLALTADPSERLLRQVQTGAGEPGAKSPPPAPNERNVHAEQVIRTVQQSLTNAGYAAGKIDGRMGEDTVRAIREFEIDQGLPETGRVSGQLVARLARLAGQGRLTQAGR